MWFGFALKKGDSPKAGDVVTVESDSAGVDAAPFTGTVESADGWSLDLEGDQHCVLDPDNLVRVSKNRGPMGGSHWFFSKADVKPGNKKPAGKGKPYVHPYRDDKGSFSTKDNDAFNGSGTTRDQHAQNLETAKAHGFKTTVDDRTATTMEKGKHRLFIDHAQGQFAHTVTYPSGASRQFSGHNSDMDAHLTQWS